MYNTNAKELFLTNKNLLNIPDFLFWFDCFSLSM